MPILNEGYQVITNRSYVWHAMVSIRPCELRLLSILAASADIVVHLRALLQCDIAVMVRKLSILAHVCPKKLA
jgi:hypothetical protein